MRKLSWEKIEEAVEELGNKIKDSGFKPDYIIGITTGGIVPLGLLVKQLGLRNILTVSAGSYEKDKQKELSITYMPEIDLSNKKILLVDEIAETGKTLKKISEAVLEKYKAGQIKTAVIVVNKERCIFMPDFFVVEEPKEWVVFPWEKKEFPEYFE